jgi:hypothetical protein
MNANQPRLGSTSLFIDPKMPDSRQGTTISRWGVAALPLSVFVGVVLGAGVGAAVANIGIGVAIGAGFGVGIGVAVTVAIFVFRSSE